MYDVQTRERVLDMYAKGMSVREISKELGGRPGKSIISRWVRGFEPTGKRRYVRQHFTVEEKRHAIARVYEGESYRDVAKEMGCTPSAIIVWRKAFEERGVDGITTTRDRRAALEHRARREGHNR